MTDLAELFSLRDQVALVTGGYGGIGEAVCRAFAKLGARVAVAGSKEAAASRLAGEIDSSGERTMGIGFDARDVGSVQRMTETVAGRWGRLDVLVNCVGGNIREERASDVTESGWNDHVSRNQRVGSTWSESVSGPRFRIVIRMRVSSGSAFA